MAVTAEQLESLRALLKGNVDEFRVLNASLDREAAKTGYTALISCAFMAAADRRFDGKATDFEIARYVADVRSRSGRLAELDPMHAEDSIREALDRDPIHEMDTKAKVETQLSLLGALVGDLELDEAGLDAFLAEARRLADIVLEHDGK